MTIAVRTDAETIAELRRELDEARLALEQLADACDACSYCLRPGHTTEEHDHAAAVGCPIEEVMEPRPRR
jgi:hypothetical protein